VQVLPSARITAHARNCGDDAPPAGWGRLAKGDEYTLDVVQTSYFSDRRGLGVGAARLGWQRGEVTPATTSAAVVRSGRFSVPRRRFARCCGRTSECRGSCARTRGLCGARVRVHVSGRTCAPGAGCARGVRVYVCVYVTGALCSVRAAPVCSESTSPTLSAASSGEGGCRACGVTLAEQASASCSTSDISARNFASRRCTAMQRPPSSRREPSVTSSDRRSAQIGAVPALLIPSPDTPHVAN
jgi:hypothetical protein